MACRLCAEGKDSSHGASRLAHPFYLTVRGPSRHTESVVELRVAHFPPWQPSTTCTVGERPWAGAFRWRAPRVSPDLKLMCTAPERVSKRLDKCLGPGTRYLESVYAHHKLVNGAVEHSAVFSRRLPHPCQQ